MTYRRTPSHQGLTPSQLGILMTDLNPARIAKRSQGGASLSYVEAHDVKATLIRVFGFGGFSAEVIESEVLRVVEKPGRNDKINNLAICKATVRLTIHATGAVYTETAIGSNEQPAIDEALDTAMKSAESDALKRCAIYLGTQFGLSLYNNGSNKEIVRVVFEDEQQGALSAVWQQQQEAAAAAQEQAQALLNRATGQSDTPQPTSAPENGSESVEAQAS